MRHLLPLSALLTSTLFASTCVAQSIALTFDDGPVMADNVGLTVAERNAAILSQLKSAKVMSVLFVSKIDNDAQRWSLIRAWGEQGHGIGNHTANHPSFNRDNVTLSDFEREIRVCDEAIESLPGYVRLFRFPYLKEGDTREKRDGVRLLLKSMHYRPGAVSIDASDWYYSQRLRDRLIKEPQADRRPYRDAYLSHLYDRAVYYDKLSKQVTGRSVQHVLLLHHNLINALFVGDVIHLFKRKGWNVVNADVAFRDPVYAIETDILPAGEGVLWSLAKQKGVAGLRYPAEDSRYEESILDNIER